MYFLTVMAALLFAALSGAPLSWDGSYVLFRVLDDQSVLAPHGRFIHAVLQWPVLAATHFTDDLRVLRVVFGAAYATIPLLALLLSWWIVRKHSPALFVWPSLAICFGTLPGQFGFISEALMVSQLAWPIILAVLCPIQRRTAFLVLLLAWMVFFSHPLSSVIFGYLSILCFCSMLRNEHQRLVRSLIAVLFGMLSVTRFVMIRSGYETEQVSLEILQTAFMTSVRGLPLAALASAWFVGLTILLFSLVKHPTDTMQKLIQYTQVAVLLMSGWFLLNWARDASSWTLMLEYRYWIVFCSAPFVFFAALDSFSSSKEDFAARQAKLTERVPILIIGAVTFLTV